MKLRTLTAAVAATLSVAFALPAFALPNTLDTRMMSEPAISARHIAFVYGGDLWLADRDGGNARRLTSDIGEESSPVFSPDGKFIAFSGQYERNTDVYIVPVEGGMPQRLTFHPGVDQVQSFTPDGKSVMFTSQRAAFNNRHRHLYTIPVQGGVAQRLDLPYAARAAYSPDGLQLAYNPFVPAFLQWKRYRGGTFSEIVLYAFKGHGVSRIPQPAGHANDVDPMWTSDTIYFRSDRNGEFNLFAFDLKTKAIRQLTSHADFPVLGAALAPDGAGILYEQAGYLHLLDLQNGAARKLTIAINADLPLSRPRFVSGAKYLRAMSSSPSGARIAMEFRGEIVSVPAEKGDARNLTQTVGAHERSPIWSPDGASVAYFSDESGDYALHVRPLDSKLPVKKFKLGGAGFYDRSAWSPDSKKILFTDNGWNLYVIDLASGAVSKIASEPLYGPQKKLTASWSPDSRWISYAINSMTYTSSVYLYSLETGKSTAVTDGLADVEQPVFDKSGKYLYFLSSTNAGPSKNWFSQQNQDNRPTYSLWMAVLARDQPSPLGHESDEEKAQSKDAKDAKEPKETEKEASPSLDTVTAKDPAASKDASAARAMAAAKPLVRIDFDNIATRIVELPVPAAPMDALQAGAAGQVFFLRETDAGKASVQRFDLKDRKLETMAAEAEEFTLSGDGKKLIVHNKTNWQISAAGGKPSMASESKLKVDAIEVRVDPRAEWTQIFNEVWRINRDYFYDPGMHGVDWQAMRAKYAAFLPELSSRADLNRLIAWMCSELSVGHHRGGGGDTFVDSKTTPGGLLGADYEVVNGRYRFKKVFGGLNWNPSLRAPLAEPGLNVKAGEYLLAVGGKPLAPPANLYSFFENTANKAVELTVGPNADGSGSRVVTAVPVASEDALRNRDWVEGNIRKVQAATGGRVAYVYVPNTAALGHVYFKRYFYPQADKDAIIVDERFNGGGSVADYYMEILQKKEIAWWTMRYGADMKTPSASIQGPKAMLIDETAGSGGDLLPWMFRKAGAGPLIGKRTWGGLVGILGYPVLMDGGTITAPNLAFRTREGGWGVENEGVAPDIEVDQNPADVIAGRDPQLEKAIEVIMAELKKNPPQKSPRPAFPDKSK